LKNAGIEDPATITTLIITGKFSKKKYQSSEKSQEPMLEISMEITLGEIKKGFIPNQNDVLFAYILPSKKKGNVILPCLQSIVILPKNIFFTKKDGVWYYNEHFPLMKN